MKYICIHGHFYQPPRENPWVGTIEAQPSARPYHDWNERIARECYAPNGRSRVLNEQGRIGRVINNYAYMSFNFGPTLLSWLERSAPEAYAWILEGDRLSLELYNGHGSAMAQVYNHIIMPLANRRDRLTQVRWGLADFEYRFGRAPEGMWLAETAVDMDTLALLVDNGLSFVILAPNQAAKVRPLNPASDQGIWADVQGGTVDPRRPYRVFLDPLRKKYIDVFFYDGSVSRAVAFEHLLNSGAGFLARIQGAFGEETAWPRLVNLATDGESYGHHFKFGDMALGWVFDRLEKELDVKPINYGAFLELSPPEMEAEIVENTSWSCAHGVERWRSDCGCRIGYREGWNQAWRTPLREGLDWLRDELADAFERRGAQLLKDPWAARDDYVSVMLRSNVETRDVFLKKHQAGVLDEEGRVEVFRLMESQLMSLFMFTSCGWFFDEISGLEPVQNMKYAARAIDLARAWTGKDLEAGFLRFLKQAVPNDRIYKTGADVYVRMAVPSRMSPERAVAHYVMSRLVDEQGSGLCPVARLVKPLKERRFTVANVTALIGRAEVDEAATGGKAARTFLALDAGGAGLTCRVGETAVDLKELTGRLQPALEEVSSGTILDLFEQVLPGAAVFTLEDLIPDTRARLVRVRAKGVFGQLRDWILENYQANWEILSQYRETGEPMLHIENFLFRTVIGDRMSRLLREGRPGGALDIEAVRALSSQAKAWGVTADDPNFARMMQRYLKYKMEQVAEEPAGGAIKDLNGFLKLAREHELYPDLWESQNNWFELCRNPEYLKSLDQETRKLFEDLGGELGFLPGVCGEKAK